MLIDARGLPAGTRIEADLCIVGAGAAGITLARQLATTSLGVVVLESGGLEFEEPIQALYQGTEIGVPDEPLDISRLRFFGGSTNHWGGWCRPLDTVDFKARPAIPLSGWPIPYAELEPYYRAAQQICQLGPYTYDDLAGWARAAGAPALALDPARLASALFQVSPPTRFGQVYRADLTRAAGVRVFLHANLLELQTGDTAASVTGIRAASLEGPEFSVRAKYYVLATGGMENARLLLLSNRVQPAGLGNGHDVVGRYFMDHLWLPQAGLVRFSAPDPALGLYFNRAEIDGTPAFATLVPPAAMLHAEPIGNFRVVLNPLRRVIEGVNALKSVGRALANFSLPDHLWADLGNILYDLDAIADAAYRSAFGTRTSWFMASGAAGGPIEGASIDVNVEQVPNRDSRLTLTGERDALGQNRLALDWRPGDTERRTVARAMELVALEFGRLGLGRVHISPMPERGWPASMTGSRHHMGATRMAADPRHGVVDAECRVHGIDNLFIAGSSVFPTSGYANPTLTIVAMTLRLGDALRRRLG